MPQLSVVIITFNEEMNIGRCLESIKGIADDVIVVDSFSTDKTEEICKQYNVKFIRHEWEGYSRTKNFANSQAKYDWILSLDADEALSDELKNSILKIKQQQKTGTYKFKRLTNYCGKWIRHSGWYPDIKVRIFDRRTSKWEGTIHEHLITADSSPVLLKGDCLHYSYYTLDQHYKQSDKFSTLQAQSLYEKGKKASLIKLWLNPAIKFLNVYIIKLGILDGLAGYTISRMSAYSSYLKFKKLRTLTKK
jgi:glycosyltransferase involved in cell wall biosynthesis